MVIQLKHTPVDHEHTPTCGSHPLPWLTQRMRVLLMFLKVYANEEEKQSSSKGGVGGTEQSIETQPKSDAGKQDKSDARSEVVVKLKFLRYNRNSVPSAIFYPQTIE